MGGSLTLGERTVEDENDDEYEDDFVNNLFTPFFIVGLIAYRDLLRGL
jgi:hypothetical protein